jgi:adenylosuccinate synthase
LLPSGIFHKDTINILSNGVALNIEYLLNEIENVKKNISDSGDEAAVNLLISDRAQILMDYHVLKDNYEEERLGDKKFGSTNSGIAPFFADKYAHVGFQLWQVYDDTELKSRVKTLCDRMNIEFEYLYKKPLLNADVIYENLRALGEKIRPYVTDTAKFLRQAIADNKEILLEGQLGALRDVEHGIYPFTTSSSTLAGYAAPGAGIPPYEIKEVLAVAKAYSSAVGRGPFVVELTGSDGDELRKRGGDAGEYGATTGRPRRVGYFDVVATKYGCQTQGATHLALTNLDVLGYLDEIPICVAYELDGKRTEDFPNTALQYRAKPIYEYLPSWKDNIRGISDESKLPGNARRYADFIQEKLGLPIKYISTGPKREEIIVR